MKTHGLHSSLQSSIDKGPYVNIMNDGMITAMASEVENENAEDVNNNKIAIRKDQGTFVNQTEEAMKEGRQLVHEPADSSGRETQGENYSKVVQELTSPIKRSINQISRHHWWSLGMLAYVAIITTLPLLGSWISLIFRRKRRGARSRALGRR